MVVLILVPKFYFFHDHGKKFNSQVFEKLVVSGVYQNIFKEPEEDPTTKKFGFYVCVDGQPVFERNPRIGASRIWMAYVRNPPARIEIVCKKLKILKKIDQNPRKTFGMILSKNQTTFRAMDLQDGLENGEIYTWWNVLVCRSQFKTVSVF